LDIVISVVVHRPKIIETNEAEDVLGFWLVDEYSIEAKIYDKVWGQGGR